MNVNQFTMETLFNRSLPVFFMKNDIEFERQETLNILIQFNAKKHLEIQVTSETRLDFLYTLHMNESDYQNLKREQKFSLDWKDFPISLQKLLETCIENQKYRCCLDQARSFLSIQHLGKIKWSEEMILMVKAANEKTLISYLQSLVVEFKVRACTSCASIGSFKRSVYFAQNDLSCI
jgi:hypothetical protein